MRILILGGSGQIGDELRRWLPPLGEVQAPPRAELDVADLAALREAVRRLRPDILVNAAAYTDVDRAESEPERARQLNARVPAALAEEARRAGALLVHYSTDYVFDGSLGRPYVEEDLPRPLNVYGDTKLAGEQAVREIGGRFLILRTSWVYSLRRRCFVTRVLELARRESRLRVAADQVGSPTWCRPVAQATAELVAQALAGGHDWPEGQAGVYHLACQGWVDRYGWTRKILDLDPARQEQVLKEVVRAAAADFTQPARRPGFSALDSGRMTRTFGIQLPEWEIALRQALATGSGSGNGHSAGV